MRCHLLAACAVTLALVLPPAAASGAGRTLTWPAWTGGDEPVLNGSATFVPDRLRLADGPNQAGSAFTTRPVFDPGADFSAHAQFEIGVILGEESADGMAFVVQSDPRGAAALGVGSAALGYGSNGAPGEPARIAPSVVVELDTHRNEASAGYDDPSGNHISVMAGGLFKTSLATKDIPFLLEGAGPVFLWVDYDAATARLRVYLAQQATKPSAPVLDVDVDLRTVVGGPAYAGWTAGTAGSWAIFEVIEWTLSGAKHPTTTSLDCTASSCTVTVAEAPNTSVSPTGTVTFTGGGSCTLAPGVAGTSSCVAPAPAAGDVTATYAGSDEHFGSKDAVQRAHEPIAGGGDEPAPPAPPPPAPPQPPPPVPPLPAPDPVRDRPGDDTLQVGPATLDLGAFGNGRPGHVVAGPVTAGRSRRSGDLPLALADCDRPASACLIEVGGRLTSGGRSIALKRRRVRIAAGEAAVLKLSLPPSARRALRRTRRAALVVDVLVRGDGGAPASRRLRLTVTLPSRPRA